MTIKSSVRMALRACGYEVSRSGLGTDPFYDMSNLSPRAPVIFDVGANVGQTVQEVRKFFKKSTIHCFEPSPETYAVLSQLSRSYDNVYANHSAVGAGVGTIDLIENSNSTKSSILECAEERSPIKQRTTVPMTSIDEYCKKNRIERIDILKSDTQGYDLEVLRGASALLSGRRVHLVFLEINFAPLYKNQGSLDEIWAFLVRQGFALVSFYPIAYDEKGLASWADALFVNPSYDGIPGQVLEK